MQEAFHGFGKGPEKTRQLVPVGLEVSHFRQAAAFPEPVEDGAQIRFRGQPGGFQLPQRRIGPVEERQISMHVEDGDGSRQGLQHFILGGGLLRMAALNRFLVGLIDGKAKRNIEAVQRGFRDLHHTRFGAVAEKPAFRNGAAF